MKNKYYIIILILATFNLSCIKSNLDVEPYDVSQKIFRVIAYYKNEPYNISITQARPNTNNSSFSVLNTTQNANFEFGFTPAAGDTIKVKANSKTGSFTIFAHYLGKDLGEIALKPTENNDYSTEFIYVIPR